MKILVVEDDKTVAQYVKRGLEEAGNHVDAAGDGEQGLSLASDGHYDLLVLDLRLPKLEGREAGADRGHVRPARRTPRRARCG